MSIEQLAVPDQTTALARLCAATPDVFAREVWARRAWLSRAPDLVGDVHDLFSRGAADELLSRRGLRTPFLRMARDGKVLPASRFTGSGGAGAMIGDQVRDDAVLDLFSGGATVVLQGLHRTWAPVSSLAAGLAAEVGHPVQVNSYITPPQSQGFSPHYDTHDVFVLQVEGRKHWRVHDPVRPDPLPDETWERVGEQVTQRAAQAPALEATLEPGDCLYLPRGFVHAATALGQTSIHLTFGIHSITQRDAVRAVLDEVLEGDWRASMPFGWEPCDDLTSLEEMRQRALAALATLDLQQVAAALHDKTAARQRPEPLSPLAQAGFMDDLGPGALVRLRRGLAARLEPEHLVVSGGRRLPIAREDRDGVAVILRGRPVAVDALPGGRAADLVRSLLRAGVVVPHHDSADAGA